MKDAKSIIVAPAPEDAVFATPAILMVSSEWGSVSSSQQSLPPEGTFVHDFLGTTLDSTNSANLKVPSIHSATSFT